MKIKYYKLLFGDVATYSGFKWDLSGNWMEIDGELIVCENGFHVLRLEHIVFWLECGFDLYEVEGDGECIEDEHKVVFKRELYN